MESALWVVWGLPEAQEEGRRLPWLQVPPEPALSPQERPSSPTTRAGPSMASSSRRAWSSSARPSSSCVCWPSAGSDPRPSPARPGLPWGRRAGPAPERKSGQGGPGNAPGEPVPQLVPVVTNNPTGLVLPLWLSHTLEQRPSVPTNGFSPRGSPFTSTLPPTGGFPSGKQGPALSVLFWKGEGSGWPSWVLHPQ